jgi:hypothetical protein
MGFRSIPEKEAVFGGSITDYGHYMGLNFGVFFKTGLYIGPDFFGEQSDGFTGFFRVPEWGDISSLTV